MIPFEEENEFDNHIGDTRSGTVALEKTVTLANGFQEYNPKHTYPTVIDTVNAVRETAIQHAVAWKKPLFSFSRSLVLVSSGLVLGVGVALVASYKTNPFAEASSFSMSPTIVKYSSEQNSEGEGLVIDSKVQELEGWFAEQPVPVNERVFLHAATKDLKTRKVNFQAPAHVDSSYDNIPSSEIVTRVKPKDGRYLVDKNRGIEWQGGFKLNNPKENVASAEKYIKDVEGKFGKSSTKEFKKLIKPTENYSKQSKQRSFGPLIK